MKASHEFESEQEWKDYLRVYFAGRAMQGIMSQSHGYSREGAKADWINMGWGWGEDACNQMNAHNNSVAYVVAEFSVRIADALLSELSKTPKP